MFFENFPKLISVKKCLIDNKIICHKMRIKRMFSSGEDDGEWDPTRVVTIHVPHNAAVQVHI